MAKEMKEYYVCDRCKKEITEDGHYDVMDGINAYYYDLCDKCYKDYEEYKSQVGKLDEEIREITKVHKFGRHMFTCTPADFGLTAEELVHACTKMTKEE